MLPDLLASVTFGDTPKNGLEDVEEVTQSRGSYFLTQDDIRNVPNKSARFQPDHFGPKPKLSKLKTLGR